MDPSQISLRTATPADSAFVFDVTRQAMRSYVDLAWGWDDAREQQRHNERWSGLRHRIIVAEGADAGYMSTAIYDLPTGGYPPGFYLHQLMILPGFQSRGVGSDCLRRLQAEALELGRPLRFRVLRVNPRALAFYLAHGCKVVGESEWHHHLEWVSDVSMRTGWPSSWNQRGERVPATAFREHASGTVPGRHARVAARDRGVRGRRWPALCRRVTWA